MTTSLPEKGDLVWVRGVSEMTDAKTKRKILILALHLAAELRKAGHKYPAMRRIAECRTLRLYRIAPYWA
jgi:hypothetical protein